MRWGVVVVSAPGNGTSWQWGVMRHDREMVISPAKDATFVFEEGDRIIVLVDSL